jgi:hypothetical protein
VQPDAAVAATPTAGKTVEKQKIAE